MAEIEFTIERQGFESIALDTEGSGPYGFRASTAGLGVPPVANHFTEGAGEGGTLRGSRTGMRPMDLGIIFLGGGRLVTGDLIRDLAALVRRRKGFAQPRLVARYASGEVFELPFVYESGLEIDHTDALPDTYRCVMSVMCPAPFWTARDAVQFSVMNDSEPVGLLPRLAELNVMGSTAIGSIEVENPGDVESDVSWVITGPGGPIPVSVNGVGFTFVTPLVLGEVVTIRRTALGVSVTDQLGANRYADLAAAPKFPSLPPGASTVDLSMSGASSGVRVATTDVVATNRVVSPALRVNATGWSTFATSATASRVSTGFAGKAGDGFMNIQWTANATAEAAVRVDAAVVPGESLSGSMSVLSSVAQAFRPTAQFVSSAGVPVGPLFIGDLVEVPAWTATVVGFAAADVGVAPAGATVLRFMASVDAVAGQSWPSGATLKASLAIITDVPMAYFDGSSAFSGWTGAANASTSTLFRTIIVGQSAVAGFFKPRREVVY